MGIAPRGWECHMGYVEVGFGLHDAGIGNWEPMKLHSCASSATSYRMGTPAREASVPDSRFPDAVLPLPLAGEGWGEGGATRKCNVLSKRRPHPHPPLRVGLSFMPSGYANGRGGTPSTAYSPRLALAARPLPGRSLRAEQSTGLFKAPVLTLRDHPRPQ